MRPPGKRLFDYKYWIAELIGFFSAFVATLIVDLPLLFARARPSPVYWLLVVVVFFGTDYLVSRWVYRKLKPPEGE